MATSPSVEGPEARQAAVSRPQIIFQIAVLILLVLLLLIYKGAAGIGKIRQTSIAGKLHVASLPIGGGVSSGSALSTTLTYLGIVWPALLFGVLISATARTSFQHTPLYAMFQGSTVRDQLTGALAGPPLMLCSCCVAPIFPTVYQRTRRVGPALAMTLASPSLNPAALVLSFMLFPIRVAGARLAMALSLVLMGSLLAAKLIDWAFLPDLRRWRSASSAFDVGRVVKVVC